MPTGTKIAVIVLVVLLGAAGLYYAFVPPAPTPKSDSMKSGSTGTTSTLGSGVGSSTLPGSAGALPNSTGTLGAPSTLPPAGTGAPATGLSSSGTPTTDGLEALANRQRQLNGLGGAAPAPASGATTASNAGGATGAASPAAPGTAQPANGALTGNTTGGTGTSTVPAGTGSVNPNDATQPAAPGGAVSSRGFNNGFKSGLNGQNPTGTSSTTSTGGTGMATPTNPDQGTTKVATGSSSEQTHVVKKGETMESIAKSYYGAGSKWQLIAKANPTVNPDTMRIGTKLRIPASGASAGSETTVASRSGSNTSPGSSATASTASSSGASHVVAKGETLSSIARRYYGDSKYWKSILKANPKVKADSLAVGTKLVIPSKTVVVGGGNVGRTTDQ